MFESFLGEGRRTGIDTEVDEVLESSGVDSKEVLCLASLDTLRHMSPSRR